MYKLIAFDMDGTLLNSRKLISSKSMQMIKEAVKQGKIVSLCTGRCPAELAEHLPWLAQVRYMICSSGALVYDLREKRRIYSNSISGDVILKILEIARLEEPMVHYLSETSIVQKSHCYRMADYHMAQYQESYKRITVKWENIYDEYINDPFPMEKMNLYHITRESRERTKRRIEEAGIPVTMALAETTSLEISSYGINKGVGLEKLCGYLGISLTETIAVGDADNDIEVLKKAGLAIAMGNANDKVKRIADVIVKDCDHNGCAQAIIEYLL